MRKFNYQIRHLVLTIALTGPIYFAAAQNVGIGTATPLEKLHVVGNIRSSTLAGVGNRLVLADPNGTLIIAGGGIAPAWMITGNTGTSAALNFLGTIDSVDLVVKTRSTERYRVFAAGPVSMNCSTTQAGDVLGVYGTGYAGAINAANNFAINGYVNSAAGSAIYGENASGIAVFGNSGVLGVFGASNSGTGFGVQAVNANANGTGIIATGNNLGGIYLGVGSGASFRGTRFGTLSFSAVPSGLSGSAVLGINNKNTIVSFTGGAGVTGIDSSAGSGVIGASYAAGGEGVYGVGFGSSGTGVLGVANAGTSPYGIWGVVPTATSGGTSIAVLGDNQTTNANAIGVLGTEAAGANGATRWALFGNGDIGASGVKSFNIDHPLDPANKYLKHFSVESDQILNLYRGNVFLDANGEAVVQLPAWFESVNGTDYTYNLTPIGQSALLYIKQEVTNKQFVIAGGAPGMKVSWQLSAERNDPYLQQNPELRAVEVAKTGSAVGRYLMPGLYGKGIELQIYGKTPDLKVATPASSSQPSLNPPR
ncbi:MAG TPA: hypothetical protein VFW78_09895 [Bacteroidia bacterium]|nr:hypothetical protein [Bacteroidia bacterium]